LILIGAESSLKSWSKFDLTRRMPYGYERRPAQALDYPLGAVSQEIFVMPVPAHLQAIAKSIGNA
jgi:hypothetical protein